MRVAKKGRLRAAFLLFPIVLFALTAGGQNLEAGAKKAQVCFACHGPNGNSADAKFPILAGQTARYLYLQIRDFKEGRRSEPTMEPFVKDLSRDDMFDLAAFFAAQRPRNLDFKVDEARAARGKRKADETLCTMCHLGAYQGQNEIPRLAFQHYDYTVKQLQDFKARRRTNDAGNMTAVARTLSDSDIEDLGHFLASLR
ncbi:MAG TPA: c-type cytochrome [Burkholderiales bacterium]|nr:c-type cytochrome [Burkholderiales bacterium]